MTSSDLHYERLRKIVDGIVVRFYRVDLSIHAIKPYGLQVRLRTQRRDGPPDSGISAGMIQVIFDHDVFDLMSMEASDGVIIRHCYECLYRALEHELSESFYYEGKRIYDPHAADHADPFLSPEKPI